MRILVVDDQEDSRDLTEGALVSAGYDDIATATSAWDALKILDIGRTTRGDPNFDLALLDIVMPEMDGVEVCARIRNDPRYADLPIIMVTSLDDMSSLANAFAAGATDYVTKPVNCIELGARVRTALRLKQELDRRQARERELLDFLSSWADRRARIWIDEATDLFAGEAAEAYLAARGDRADEGGEALALAARAVNRLPATIGTIAAAYGNGVIVLIAPGLGADLARNLADDLYATVQKLRLPACAGVAGGYTTASVAVITGRAARDIDRIQLLTQAIAGVRQVAAAGGDRVVALPPLRQ
jgi:sigma-B regulation protein RsbU (phosphoserine phosphatase)